MIAKCRFLSRIYVSNHEARRFFELCETTNLRTAIWFMGDLFDQDLCQTTNLGPVDAVEAPRNPLLPDRHEERDFFVCDIFDATPKSDQASMQFPMFSLSNKPDMTPREYFDGDKFVRLDPSSKGLATVFDRDILIYAVSQCMAKLARGQRVERTLRFHAHDLMVATNRETSGDGYRRLREAMHRLRSTNIETNIQLGGVETTKGFGFIDEYEIVRETRSGRAQLVEITLSQWLFGAINEKGKDLLTISRGYFRLRKPLERRMYDLARKHCGRNKPKWTIHLTTLHKKTGSASTIHEFKRLVDNIVKCNNEHQHFPDYTIEIEDKDVIFRPRSDFLNRYLPKGNNDGFDANSIKLPTDISEIVRPDAGGYDIYYLEEKWREMLAQKKSLPKNATGSFRNYVKWYVKRYGRAN